MAPQQEGAKWRVRCRVKGMPAPRLFETRSFNGDRNFDSAQKNAEATLKLRGGSAEAGTLDFHQSLTGSIRTPRLAEGPLPGDVNEIVRRLHEQHEYNRARSSANLYAPPSWDARDMSGYGKAVPMFHSLFSLH